MSVDEVTQGPEAPTRRPPPSRLWVAAAILLVGLTAFAVLRSGPALPRQAGPDPAPSSATSPEPDQRFLVSVESVCPGVVEGRALTLSFTLVNVARIPVTVESVTPSLPLGRLQTLQSRLLGAGRCDAPDNGMQGGRLEPGAMIAVLFRFALPSECPAPYPVAASVLVSSGGPPVTNEVVVAPDLGDVEFASCAAR